LGKKKKIAQNPLYIWFTCQKKVL